MGLSSDLAGANLTINDPYANVTEKGMATTLAATLTADINAKAPDYAAFNTLFPNFAMNKWSQDVQNKALALQQGMTAELS